MPVVSGSRKQNIPPIIIADPNIEFGSHGAVDCVIITNGATTPPTRPPIDAADRPVALITVGNSSHANG